MSSLGLAKFAESSTHNINSDSGKPNINLSVVLKLIVHQQLTDVTSFHARLFLFFFGGGGGGGGGGGSGVKGSERVRGVREWGGDVGWGASC